MNNDMALTPADVRERVAKEVYLWEATRFGAAESWALRSWEQESNTRRELYFNVADRILALLRTPRGEGERVQEPTQEQIDDACIWYRHDFGLLSEKERDSVRFEALQWFRAWGKALSNETTTRAPADVREQIKAAIREGVRYIAKADGAYLYEPSVDETVDRILALLRTPRGDGEDRWEDLVFGPIVEAYNEAHAARRSDAQEKGDALVCASCGESIGNEPTVIWQGAYTHYRCTPEDAIRDDTPVIRPIDTARRGEGGGK